MDWSKVYAAGEATIVVVSDQIEPAIRDLTLHRVAYTIEEAVELKRRGFNCYLVTDVTRFATETEITDVRVDCVLVTYFDEPNVFVNADVEVIPPRRREWEDECGMPEPKPVQKKSYVLYRDRKRFVSANEHNPLRSIWWGFMDDETRYYTGKCVLENETEARRFFSRRLLFRNFFVAVGVRVRKYGPIPLVGAYTMDRSTRAHDLYFDSTGLLNESLGHDDRPFSFGRWFFCTTKLDVCRHGGFNVVVLFDDEPAPDYVAALFDGKELKYELLKIETQIAAVPNRSMNRVRLPVPFDCRCLESPP